jgi:hypothetical protein
MVKPFKNRPGMYAVSSRVPRASLDNPIDAADAIRRTVLACGSVKRWIQVAAAPQLAATE